MDCVFTIYDSAADAYLPPWIMPNVTMAQRAFSDCVNAKDHQFAANPQDYTLFMLGDWDSETAEFRPLPAGKRSLGVAIEYVRRENAPGQMDLVHATEGAQNVEPEATRIQSSSQGDDPEE